MLLVLLLAGCTSDSKGPPAPTTGSIQGFVLDDALAPIVGANVTVTGFNHTFVTDSLGSFILTNVTPGNYRVSAEAPRYYGKQSPVDVVAGNQTTVRLVLPANTTALAFHQSTSFRGFVDASTGPTSGGVATCECEFSINMEGTWQTIVVEARWVDVVANPVTPTEYAWSISIQDQAVSGQGPSPLLGRVAPSDFKATASTAAIRVEPASDWLYVNQGFDVLVTVWYGEPAPAGWHALQT